MARALLEQSPETAKEADLTGSLDERVREAVSRASRRLLQAQKPDGHWCAELEGDTILESEYILCLYFLGRAAEDKVRRAADYLRHEQGSDGGWSCYPGGPADVSVSVKAYLVLKLAGDDPSAPHLQRARQRISELGGIEACNSFTKIYLAVFGEYEWSRCPAVPPEIALLPRWFYLNLYAMSSWTRTIVVPLSIIWAHKPVCPLPEHARIPELRDGAPVRPPRLSPKERWWSGFFRAVNTGLKIVEALRIRPWRRRALKACEAWVLPRLENSDGLGAIFPPIINTLIAFRCLGYSLDHPVMVQQLHELEKLEIEEDGRLRLQPCLSPVWDTTLALSALQEAGFGSRDESLIRAARWLLSKEVRAPGDQQVIDPSIPIGGWYFEYANEFYPDCDDTAEVLKALAGLRFDDPAEDLERQTAMERGQAWMRAMQNRDGGWAAFDRGCDRESLTFVPFADHNAMIDPSTSDITARGVIAFRACGTSPDAEIIERAKRFLLREQERDGSWYGRWGCNYLYGTWLALSGLRAAGEAMDRAPYQRAAQWLRDCQNDDGGWGELPASYDDPGLKGRGPSTASQTAWALMGLSAAGDDSSDSVIRGIEYLLENQRAAGDWHDEHWTGTGFPKVFYLRYHFYGTYFPLQALAMHQRRSAPRPEPRSSREIHALAR